MSWEEDDHEPLSAAGDDEVATYRRVLLEGVSGLETPLDSVLAVYLGQGERGQQVLYRDVIWRVPYEARIELLIRLLTEDERIEYYPFIRDHLPEVVGVRNVLAHMVLDIFESTDETLVFIGRRRGDDQRRKIEMRRLHVLTLAMWHIRADLWALHQYLSKRGGSFVPSAEELPYPLPEEDGLRNS